MMGPVFLLVCLFLTTTSCCATTEHQQSSSVLRRSSSATVQLLSGEKKKEVASATTTDKVEILRRLQEEITVSLSEEGRVDYDETTGAPSDEGTATDEPTADESDNDTTEEILDEEEIVLGGVEGEGDPDKDATGGNTQEIAEAPPASSPTPEEQTTSAPTAAAADTNTTTTTAATIEPSAEWTMGGTSEGTAEDTAEGTEEGTVDGEEDELDGPDNDKNYPHYDNAPPSTNQQHQSQIDDEEYVPPNGGDILDDENEEGIMDKWRNGNKISPKEVEEMIKDETDAMLHDKYVPIVAVFVALVSVVFVLLVVQQMVENPQGCLAKMCRCTLAVVRFFCWPCRKLCSCCCCCCGSKNRPTGKGMYGAHDRLPDSDLYLRDEDDDPELV